jgi:hypothetical protein
VWAYLQDLLAPIERKNGWQLAENAGDRPPALVCSNFLVAIASCLSVSTDAAEFSRALPHSLQLP